MLSEQQGEATLVDAHEDTLVDPNEPPERGARSGKTYPPSFVRVSGARTSVADAFSLQADGAAAASTPTKRQRAARKIEQWVREHAVVDDLHEDTSFDGSQSSSSAGNAYLAYPHLKTGSTHSFVLVEGDETGPTYVDLNEHPQTPAPRTPPIPKALSAIPRLKTRLSSAILRSSTSQDTIAPRHRLNASTETPIRSDTASPTPLSSRPSSTRASSRSYLVVHTPHSIFKRRLTPDSQRDGSGNASASCAYTQTSPRPSVLGIFSSPSLVSTDGDLSSSMTSSDPRPSLASSRTYATSASSVSRSSSPLRAASPHKFSTTRNAASLISPSIRCLHSASASSANISGISQRMAMRVEPIPMDIEPSLMAKTVPAFLLPPSSRKRRTLVVSGIRPGDLPREAALRKWCTAQGEVGRIVRVVNGDIHVYYKSAEVAEHVCCFRGGVVISGVGSVVLSWFKGRTP